MLISRMADSMKKRIKRILIGVIAILDFIELYCFLNIIASGDDTPAS